MKWVAMDVNLGRDPAVHRIAAELNVRVAEVVGSVELIFSEMAQHAQDGQLGDVPDSLLETWALWQRRRGALAAAFRREFCDESGLVTSWERLNGRAIRKAKAEVERVTAHREKAKAERSDTRTVTRNNARNTTPELQVTLPNPTLPNPTEESDARASDDWSADAKELWQDRVGIVRDDEILALQPIVDRHDWPTVRTDLIRWIEEQTSAGRDGIRPGWYAERALQRLASSFRTGSAARNGGADVVEGGEKVARLRALVEVQHVPGQSSKRVLRRDRIVAELGADVDRALLNAGGVSRVIELEEKGGSPTFLAQDLAAQLQRMRQPQEKASG